MKILLVDDDILNLKLIEEILEPMEHNLLKAMDGQMALSILKENLDTDLILLDILMPDMSGFELCSIIKTDDALKNIPLILVTALADVSNQIKGFKYGVSDYVTKPFEPEILKAKINNQLFIKNQRDSLIELSLEKDELISELTEALERIKALILSCKQ